MTKIGVVNEKQIDNDYQLLEWLTITSYIS